MFDKYLYDQIKYNSAGGAVIEASALFSFDGAVTSQAKININAQGIISGECEITSGSDIIRIINGTINGNCEVISSADTIRIIQGIVSGECEVISSTDTVKTPGSYRIDPRHPLFSQGLIVKRLECKVGDFSPRIIIVSSKKEKQQKLIKIAAQKVVSIETAVPIAKLSANRIKPVVKIASLNAGEINKPISLALEKEYSLNNMMNIYKDSLWGEQLPSAIASNNCEFGVELNKEYIAKQLPEDKFVGNRFSEATFIRR